MSKSIFKTIKKKSAISLFLVFFVGCFNGIAQTITGSLNVNQEVFCESGEAVFTAVFTGEPNLEYRFSVNGTPVQNNYTSINRYVHQITELGFLDVTVEVRSGNNPPVSAAKRVTTIERPVAIAGDNRTICTNTSTRLGIQILDDNRYNYEWTPVNRLLAGEASLPNPQTTNLTANQTYTLTVRDKTLNTCSSSASVTVTARALPANLAANNIGGTTCAGVPVQIGVAPVGTTTYDWQPAELFEDNTLSNPTTIPLTASQRVSVKLGWSDVENCTRTVERVPVNVNPNPVVTAGEDRTICEGSTTQLGGPAVANTTYEWRPNRFVDPTVSNPVTRSTFSEDTIFIVAATSAAKCVSLDTVKVKVQKYATTFPLSGGGEYCAGESTAANYVELASSQNGFLYDLYMNGESYSTRPGNGSAIRWTSLPGGRYTVVAKKDIGNGVYCETPFSGMITVNEFVPPTATISAPDSMCSGVKTDIIVNLNGIAPFTFTIENSLGQTRTIQTNESFAIIEETISRSVSTEITWTILDVSDSNPLQCKNTFSGNNPQATSMLNPVPQVQINSDLMKEYACVGERVELSVRNPLSTERYEWSNSTEGPTTVIRPDSERPVTVRTTNSHGCFSIASITIPVRQLPVVTISGYNENTLYCRDDEPAMLTGTPEGLGSFEGVGIREGVGMFYPEDVLTGITTVTYSYTDELGCKGWDAVTLRVNPTPTVDFSVGAPPYSGPDTGEVEDAIEICWPGTELSLQGISPLLQGWWELPSSAGSAWLDTIRAGLASGQAFLVDCQPGSYQLRYSVSDANGCIGFKEKTLVIHDVAPDSIPMGTLFRRDGSGLNAGDAMCRNSSYEEIWVQGRTDGLTGNFSISPEPPGMRISDDVGEGVLRIRPDNAQLQSTYNISYSIKDINWCKHSTSKDFYIQTPINIQLIGLQESYCMESEPVELFYKSHIPVKGTKIDGDELEGFYILKRDINTGVVLDTLGSNENLTSEDRFLFHPSWGVGEYEFVFNYSDGVCENTNIQPKIKVNPNPEIIFNIPPQICYGEMIPLRVTPQGGIFYYKTDTGIVKMPANATLLDTKDTGVGIIMIYYQVERSRCVSMDSTMIRVLGVPDYGVRQRCDTGDETTVYLTGSEVGGTYVLYVDNQPYDTIQGMGSEVSFQKTITDYATCFVRAESAAGCRSQLTERVNIRPLNVKLSKLRDISCNGRKDGAATALVSGGLAPYDFRWSVPGEQSPLRDTIRNLEKGFYYFQVIDSVGCTYHDTIEITEPDLLKVSIENIIDPTCGEPNGSVDAKVEGGTANFTYEWFLLELDKDSLVSENASLFNVGGGTYEVRVTDRNGCTARDSRNLRKDPPLVITVDNVVHNTIFGESEGSIDITVTGGVSPYTYTWQGEGITPANQNDEDLKNLPQDTYILDVIDGNQCLAQTRVEVKQPEQLMVNVKITPVTCHGLDNGVISLDTIIGGVREYSIEWRKNGENEIYSTARSIKGTAGDYRVTITDASGKTFNRSYQITQPSPLKIITMSTTNTTLLCHGDSTGVIDFSIDGGVTPYIIQFVSSSSVLEHTNLMKYVNLPKDAYFLRVRDDNKCMTDTLYSVTQPKDSIDFRTYIKQVTCDGSDNGAIRLDPVIGGTEPYTFTWFGGNAVNGSPVQTNLKPGVYRVKIEDANRCARLDSFYLRPPVASAVKLSAPETFCTGDSIELRFDFTGVPALSVYYSDGIEVPGYIPLMYSPTFVTVASPERSTYYRIEGATDGNHCPAAYSDSVYVAMLPAPRLTVVNIPADICLGDSIEVDLFLQQGPQWSIEYNDNGGIQTINNITDANYKMKIATNRLTNELSYEILSISNGQCKVPVNIRFTVNVRKYPTLTITPPDVVCAGNTFRTKLEFTGDAPWTVDYLLGDFVRTDSVFSSPFYIEDILSKNTAYHFTGVTSNYGCKTELDRKINIEVNPLPADAFSIEGASLVCLGEGDYETPVIPRANSYHWTLPEGVEIISGNETNKIKVRFTEKSKAGFITVQGRNRCGLGVAISHFVTAPRILGKAGNINSVTEICRNNTEPVSMSIPPIDNADNYRWLLPPGFNIVFGENSSSIMITTERTAQSGIVRVWGENNCGRSDTSSLRVNILEAPVVVAGADKSIGCNEANRLRFEALNPAPAFGQWRLVFGSGIIADIYDPHSEVTGLDLGRNVFQWEVSDGKCSGIDSVVITNVNVDLTSPSFSETVTCMDSIALKAGLPRQGTGEWSLVGGGGIVEQINATEAMVYELEMGTSFFRWQVSNEFCSRDTVIQVTSNSPKKFAFAGEDETVFMPAAVLNARQSEAGVVGGWSVVGGSSVLDNLSNPRSIVRNLSAGLNTFRWTVSFKGCIEFDETIIFYDTELGPVDKGDFIVFPNVFSPNPVYSNGGVYSLEIQIPHYRDINVFYPVWRGVDKTRDYALQIFNRWGNLIFQSNDIERGWDGYINGELAPMGTYIYKANGVFLNGKTFTKTGEINLLQ